MKYVVTFIRNKNDKKYGYCLVVNDIVLKILKEMEYIEILSIK